MSEPKPNYGKRNRTMGHNAERLYAKLFKEHGFDKCITSRKGSRLLDDCKVDLMFLPFLTQIKAGVQKGLNVTKVFQEMREELGKHFPSEAPEQSMPRILIHHKALPKGRNRRDEYDQLVIMSFDDFLKLLKP